MVSGGHGGGRSATVASPLGTAVTVSLSVASPRLRVSNRDMGASGNAPDS